MKPIDINKATRLINCGEVILVTAGFDDKFTITTCAWHMPVCKDPPLLAIALAKKHFSSELILKGKEFAINIPDWELLDKVMLCGSISGRQIDKFEHANLTKLEPKHLKYTPKIAECIGNIECSLFDVKEAGDHYIFVGKVLYAQVKKQYFLKDFWDTNKVNLIFHLGSKFFFKSSPYISL
ncbi:MAG: flavin reductase family protein [Candidatus Omnitrophica bacterium]|nr:flavin reductase family protein [Candidatus Omnitrophota bacterium]